jgi:hypothetical protein
MIKRLVVTRMRVFTVPAHNFDGSGLLADAGDVKYGWLGLARSLLSANLHSFMPVSVPLLGKAQSTVFAGKGSVLAVGGEMVSQETLSVEGFEAH